MSDTMEEGVIVEWLKNIGDAVQPGDIMAEVETDKATMELESYNEGILLHQGVKAGEAIPVNGVLAVVGEKGENIDDLLKQAESEVDNTAEEPTEEPVTESISVEESKPEPLKTEQAPVVPRVSTTVVGSNGRIKASPLAKKMASERGIDLALLKGTGEDGRIVKRDIESYQPVAQPQETGEIIHIPAFVGEESYEEVNASQMRKAIARRLGESKFSAPHFYLTMEINMDKAVEARQRINESSPIRISYNDMIIKAAALALRQNPKVNSSWLGDKIRYNKHIHVGMAVAIDDGLIVPVIRFADGQSLSQISSQAKDLGKRAKAKQLQPEEYAGNTFTISNLGMFDIDYFTAIINPPDACIMAVGTVKQVPGVIGGEVKPVYKMKVTLSCDHRVVDGVTGSQFLTTFKELLEDPVRMLI